VVLQDGGGDAGGGGAVSEVDPVVVAPEAPAGPGVPSVRSVAVQAAPALVPVHVLQLDPRRRGELTAVRHVIGLVDDVHEGHLARHELGLEGGAGDGEGEEAAPAGSGGWRVGGVGGKRREKKEECSVSTVVLEDVQ
jgi:hypothetical protein